jgi:hypothetical protein
MSNNIHPEDHTRLKSSNYSDQMVFAYFRGLMERPWLTLNGKKKADYTPSELAFIYFNDLVEGGTPREEAFAEAYIFLESNAAINDQ